MLTHLLVKLRKQYKVELRSAELDGLYKYTLVFYILVVVKRTRRKLKRSIVFSLNKRSSMFWLQFQNVYIYTCSLCCWMCLANDFELELEDPVPDVIISCRKICDVHICIEYECYRCSRVYLVPELLTDMSVGRFHGP